MEREAFRRAAVEGRSPEAFPPPLAERATSDAPKPLAKAGALHVIRVQSISIIPEDGPPAMAKAGSACGAGGAGSVAFGSRGSA